MPIHHVLECNKCGTISEHVTPGAYPEGHQPIVGECAYRCAEAWQDCPKGWTVSEPVHRSRKLLPTVITCPDCRGKQENGDG